MVSLSDIYKNIAQGGLYRTMMNDEKKAEQAAAQEMKAQPEELSVKERITNALFGRAIPGVETIGTPKANSEGGITIDSSITQNPRQGGFFRDFASGYNENRGNPLKLNNFGQNKGWAKRIGEGIGSTVRFVESAPGRSLITAGLISSMGGTPLEAIAYGGTAGMINQANRTADRIYRDDLIRSQQTALRNSPEFAALGTDKDGKVSEEGVAEQQRQLQAIADNINAQRGYMNKDIYSNLINTQQMRDNTDWRKLYFDTQQENNQINREFQQRQLDNSIAQANANRALQWAELNERKHQNNISNALQQQKILADMQKGGEGFGDMRQQLDNFAASFDTVNNPYRYRIAGKGSEFFNTLTEDEANFNAQRTLLFNQIARKLGGEKGVLSDADIKRIEAALPTLADTKKQKEAKMRAVYALLNIKEGSAGGLTAKSGNNDPLGIL